MRNCCLLFLAGAVVCLAACQPPGPPAAPAAEYRATSTIREIMGAMVEAPSNVVFGATATNVTEKGEEESVLKTDEDWLKVRRAAIVLAEASDLALTPGRHVAKPGEKSKAPEAQMEPEAIEALITKSREDWTKLAHGLHDAATATEKAIDARDLKALSSASDALNTACVDCHAKYWYPKQAEDAAPAAEKK